MSYSIDYFVPFRVLTAAPLLDTRRGRAFRGTVLGSWPKGCEFDSGSRQLLGERGSAFVYPSRTIWSIATSLGELFNR